MRTRIAGILLILVVVLVTVVPVLGAGSTTEQTDQPPPYGGNTDNLPHPLGVKQSALKQKALQAVWTGQATGPVVKMADGQYVELEREDEDTIWSVLGEFGDEDSPYEVLQSGIPGPLHNEIPEPDRSVDNASIWVPDFSKEYFTEHMFSEEPGAVSMRNYYIEQSSNRFTVNGEVVDWVGVPYNAAHYGRDYCGDTVCGSTWWFLDDSVDSWYDKARTGGMSKTEINAYLASFDIWDRYDIDGDGNFDEADGYIDHFQSVHAGGGQETGGGALGSDAIWSHVWYAFFNGDGPDGAGPSGFGGIRIGKSDYWIGDYIIVPEDVGIGVLAHEFAHDLGIPDLYDMAGNSDDSENSTGFWTLMSSGAYGNDGRPESGIGNQPTHMSVLEKIVLGWSNLAVVDYRQPASIRLGPATFNTRQFQHLLLLLPEKEMDVNIGPPYSGSYQYFSGADDDLDISMTRTVTLPNGKIELSAKVNYDIELDWDYAYVTVDGQPVETNLSTNDDPNGQNFGHGITGDSGGDWVNLTADLSDYAGHTVELGFAYWTDVAITNPGIRIDDVAIPGQPLDDAESDAGWTFSGFSVKGETFSQSFFQAYMAEYRTYKGFDRSLQTGPYNQGFLDNPDLQLWLERFPYQDGLLIWYYDTSFTDNNVSEHCAAGRCGGLYLPVDAHPDLLLRPDNGNVWRARVQAYDATFSTQRTDRICLHANSQPGCYGRLPGVRKFDDTRSYWVAPDASIGNNGWASVPLPATGTTIVIRGVSEAGNYIQLRINK